MKRTLKIVLFLLLMAVTGCGVNEQRRNTNINDSALNPQQVTYHGDMFSESANMATQNSTQFGFERLQRSTFYANRPDKRTAAINRDQLAGILSTLCIQIPGIKDAATLITDEEIIIAYHPDQNATRTTDQQVRAMVTAVAPDGYQHYTTNNPVLIPKLEKIASLPINDSVTTSWIRDLITHIQNK